MADMGTIMARLGLDDSRFKTGVNNAGKWGKAKFAAIGGAMAGAFAATFAFGKFKEAMNAVASIQEMAEATGLTTEEFQRLDYQMRQVGGTSQHLVIGMNTIDRAMAKAREGNEAFIKDFERLNITQEDFANPDRMRMMLKLSEAIQGMTTESRGGILDSLRRLVGDDAAKQFIKMFQEDFVGGLANAKVISSDVIASMKELTGATQDLNDTVMKELSQILSQSKDDIKEIIKLMADATRAGAAVASKVLQIKDVLTGEAAFTPQGTGRMLELAAQPLNPVTQAGKDAARRSKIQEDFQKAQLEYLKKIEAKIGPDTVMGL